jgi:hypothetical protein
VINGKEGKSLSRNKEQPAEIGRLIEEKKLRADILLLYPSLSPWVCVVFDVIDGGLHCKMVRLLSQPYEEEEEGQEEEEGEEE